MPLPLPNLDTRRWADLAAEGRALIPRHAPAWTNHNASDPGITLVELFAWLIEADSYRTNRVLPRHRLKFLRLVGFEPKPPRPARVMLNLTLHPGQPSVRLPAGTLWSVPAGERRLPFRTLADLQVIGASIAAVQVASNGVDFADLTRAWRAGSGFLPWGPDPAFPIATSAEAHPALYLGFDSPVPAGLQFSLGVMFGGSHSGSEERARIVKELRFQPSASLPPPHHSIRTCWDCFDGSAWRPLSVQDDTRGFTLDGTVVLTLPNATVATVTGVVKAPLHYLRCRLVGGPLDEVPSVAVLAANAVPAQQACALHSSFTIRRGVKAPNGQEPVVGASGRLRLALDAEGSVTALAFTPAGEGLEATVLAYRPATGADPGALILNLVRVGLGTGLPGLALALPHAPVAAGAARLWTLDGAATREWTQRPDLDASGRTDAHFVLDATSGRIEFGDGERGEVVAAGAAVLAACEVTAAAAGNVAANASWQLSDADAVWNRSVLGADPATVAQALAAIRSMGTASGGADAEDIAPAAGRAVEALWAHDRLLSLCRPDAPATLDGVGREQVIGLAAPERAATLLDYERLALDVPGAPVARARAWAGLDPDVPGASAPGTVVVVLVPRVPAQRPQPGPALIAAVQRYLERRRLVGTRLLVVGPQYRQVTVRAAVVVHPGTRPERARDQVMAGLQHFLDPLLGGPDGRGWPFGRDVYRSEVLEVINRTAGVDHVESLELQADSAPPRCGNLCIGPLQLAASGEHAVSIVTGRRDVAVQP